MAAILGIIYIPRNIKMPLGRQAGKERNRGRREREKKRENTKSSQLGSFRKTSLGRQICKES